MANEVHQVGAVFTVMDRELDVETDLLGIHPEQSRPDPVERARPGQGIGHDRRIVAEHLPTNALDPPRHFRGGSAREGHEQDAARIGTVDDQMRHAMGQRVGLARSGTRDDQQRTAERSVRQSNTVLDRLALAVVQFLQIGRAHLSPRG